ncbi:MAG: toll/interleukin-1 receptor domain-containing protein [Rhodocyclales bacterium]|nr:toll/interleukin-1 receptor domain-containing protein [Rhodocyclales bacterium]
MTETPPAPARSCFVISPIGAEGSGYREHADEVFRHIITPALEQFGIRGVRSDHMLNPGKISEQMFEAIFGSDLCIVVLTYANPNVYYELAVAQAACRPVIMLIEKKQPLPFDIKDFRVLEYDLSITAYTEQTYIKRLAQMLEKLQLAGGRCLRRPAPPLLARAAAPTRALRDSRHPAWATGQRIRAGRQF